MNVPWVESPFFEQLLPQMGGTAEQQAQARFYHENGYLIVKNAITAEMADKAVSSIGSKFPDQMNQDPLRQQDLWMENEIIKEIAIYPKVLDMLKYLYGRESIPFQTLNFKYGTQQRAHSDSIHFSCLPARFMCGVWVALEPTSSQNGPLFYYPKSHKLPEYNYYDIGIKAHDNSKHYSEYETFIETLMGNYGIQKEELYIEKGDALIWSSNIIHGGTPIKTDGLTRWSQVTHYYFDDCVYYTPMHSDMLSHELYLRHIKNIRTGEMVENKASGEAVKEIRTTKTNYLIGKNLTTSQIVMNKIKTIMGPIVGVFNK